jgi:hypothetical protein
VKAALTPAPGKEQVGHHYQSYDDHDHYQGPHFFLSPPFYDGLSFPKSTVELTEGNRTPTGGSFFAVLYQKRSSVSKNSFVPFSELYSEA